MKFGAGKLVSARYAFEGLYYHEIYTVDQPRVENPYGNLPCVTLFETGKAKLIPERLLDAVHQTEAHAKECIWNWRAAKA